MHQEPQNSNHPGASPPERTGPLQAFKAVAWGFLGIRKRAGHETDARLTPAQIIVTGLICAAIFIGILITVVSLVLS